MKLIAEHVTKKIHGRIILDDINMEMESGHIYGIIGRNGAGKTMLFRALSGLIRVNAGQIFCDGKQLHKDFEILPDLGIVLENAGLYPDQTGFWNLKFLASEKKRVSDEEIKRTIGRVGLDPEDHRSFRKYSLGMKQRIVIAQAIMEKPAILFLDEPTNALDQRGVEEIRNIIREERKRGALVLLASHNKEDMELLADEIYYMESGRLTKQEGIYGKEA